MRRFFVNDDDISNEKIRITNSNDVHHIIKVLRLKEGEIIDISDKNQWEYKCEIISIDKDEVLFRILDKQKFATEPKIEVTLYQGIPKLDKMELIIKMCVELGIFEIVPVFTRRTVVSDKGNFSKKIQRWQKISDEAVKQCKRGIIPNIRDSLTFQQMLDEIEERAYDLVIFPYENEDKRNIKELLRNINNKPNKVCIIIGPEGGFSESEAVSLVKNNAESVSLGKTILRTETAGITCLAMTMYELEL